MAERVAGEGVEREHDDVEAHDEGADADAEVAVEIIGEDDVVPEEGQEDESDVEKIAVKILQDEWELCLALVFAIGGLGDGAGGWIQEEGAIVGFAIVIAGGAETKRASED